MHRIGIMQGRLVPPLDGRLQAFPSHAWREEFSLARLAGLDALEWIYDLAGEAANPLATDAGIEEIKSLSQRHDVAIRSVCADYFVERPLFSRTPEERDERFLKLKWLLSQSSKLGVTRIVLPFVDHSSISSLEDKSCVEGQLQRMEPYLKECGIEIHLETSLDPAGFRQLLDVLAPSLYRVNYDSGNSASLGFDPADEFRAYGDRVGSVHVKDRKRSGGTVPLGQGATDFESLFHELQKSHYRGDLILQVARGVAGQEVDWAKKNKKWVENLWRGQ